jgi:general secretion pathway protein G
MGPPPAVIPVIFAAFAVFVGVGVFIIVGVIDDATVGYAKADVKNFETNIIRYKTNMGSLPTSLEDLCRSPANAKADWRKLMEENLLTDPWGQPYQYRNPSKQNPQGYDIFSKGPDGKEDTEDDIGNWQSY